MPPKRKAAPKISRLVDGDVEDDELVVQPQTDMPEDPETAPPPTKKLRGRQKATATVTTAPTATKRTTRKRRSAVVLKPRKRAAKVDVKSTEAAEGAKVKSAEYFEENQDASEDELDSPKTVTEQAHEETEAGAQTLNDGEFEYTPARLQRGRPQTKLGSRQIQVKRQVELPAEPAEDGANNEEPVAEVDETVLPKIGPYASPGALSSPLKNRANGKLPHTRTGTQGPRWKSVRVEDIGENDADLRQKFEDVKKRLEDAETRYRQLREVGIEQANANMERLRKQCEETTSASKQLIESLKQELEMQTNLARQSRALEKQLKEKNTEVSELQSKLKDMSSTLGKAQNEIKGLQTKLAAARNATVAAENTQAKVAGRGSAARNQAANGSDAAQTARLKEDLYTDLTGLIIRNAKRQGTEDIYDCIQTGLNGTLHFKLSVSDPEGKGFDAAEFQYTPLLDSNRDKYLIDILPDYLTVDITFSRQNAAKFYSRVVDSLTKKRVDR
ncbi:hypothetical protein VTO42DRAFT_1187 [Malbranchea cinnamomea]